MGPWTEVVLDGGLKCRIANAKGQIPNAERSLRLQLRNLEFGIWNGARGGGRTRIFTGSPNHDKTRVSGLDSVVARVPSRSVDQVEFPLVFANVRFCLPILAGIGWNPK